MAGFLMFPLTVVTVAMVGFANLFSIWADGSPILPLPEFLAALGDNPGDPRFYWVYLMVLSTLLPSFLHILCGLIGLALACIFMVFESDKAAQRVAESVENVTEQSKIKFWYPAGAATGVTSLVALAYFVISTIPHSADAAVGFCRLLLSTAAWTASLFPVAPQN